MHVDVGATHIWWMLVVHLIKAFANLLNTTTAKQVKAVMEQLNLESCKDVKIGTPLARGVSGGQPLLLQTWLGQHCCIKQDDKSTKVIVCHD